MRIFPYRPPVQSDDERASSPGLFIFVGLISMAMMALALTLLVVPPALSAHLVIRGGRTGSLVMRLGGYGLMAAWFAGLVWVGRRMMGAPARPEVRPEDRSDGGDGNDARAG